MMRLELFLTELTTPDYLLVIESNIFCNVRLQPHTPDQGQGPSRVAKKKNLIQQCYQHLVIKDTTFMASLHTRLTGYSTVVS